MNTIVDKLANHIYTREDLLGYTDRRIDMNLFPNHPIQIFILLNYIDQETNFISWEDLYMYTYDALEYIGNLNLALKFHYSIGKYTMNEFDTQSNMNISLQFGAIGSMIQIVKNKGQEVRRLRPGWPFPSPSPWDKLDEEH